MSETENFKEQRLKIMVSAQGCVPGLERHKRVYPILIFLTRGPHTYTCVGTVKYQSLNGVRIMTGPSSDVTGSIYAVSALGSRVILRTKTRFELYYFLGKNLNVPSID